MLRTFTKYTQKWLYLFMSQTYSWNTFILILFRLQLMTSTMFPNPPTGIGPIKPYQLSYQTYPNKSYLPYLTKPYSNPPPSLAAGKMADSGSRQDGVPRTAVSVVPDRSAVSGVLGRSAVEEVGRSVAGVVGRSAVVVPGKSVVVVVGSPVAGVPGSCWKAFCRAEPRRRGRGKKRGQPAGKSK